MHIVSSSSSSSSSTCSEYIIFQPVNNFYPFTSLYLCILYLLVVVYVLNVSLRARMAYYDYTTWRTPTLTDKTLLTTTTTTATAIQLLHVTTGLYVSISWLLSPMCCCCCCCCRCRCRRCLRSCLGPVPCRGRRERGRGRSKFPLWGSGHSRLIIWDSAQITADRREAGS